MKATSFRRTLGFLASVLGGAGSFSAPAFAQATSAPAAIVAEYRKFAMTHDGDPARGAKIFADESRVACAKCHALGGKGGGVGPDLAAVGDQFSRAELIDSVLVPSARIAVGYGTTVVATKAGEEIQGVLKQSTDAWIELAGADGKRVRIPTADIQRQEGIAASLMPEGLQATLSTQDFADLVDYLVGLKQPEHGMNLHRGMPDVIPRLAKPIGVEPFLAEECRLPASPDKVVTGLVWFGEIPSAASRYLAAHQRGMIWRVDKSGAAEARTVFLDVTADTFSARGPNGMLGVAFHPKFPENRKYYTKRQVFEDGKITTLVEERRATADAARDSGEPARRLLRIPAVAEHHNGGCIQFGPDGFLYVGMGDSAPNFDPQGQAQNLRLLFGKMLRIDVDHRDPGLEYAVPADNPFRGRGDARGEIWAYGLREPWRFGFDATTGDLWAADLGQERGDEVDIIRRGENYGWNAYEGFELFAEGARKEGTAYVPPIYAARRKHGSAVMGGFVYRDPRNPSFRGVYVFGDYQSKRIWGMTQQDRTLVAIRQLGTVPQSITAFATDSAGNAFAVGYEGMVYRLDFDGTDFDAARDPAVKAN